jgi:hypothetical protein
MTVYSRFTETIPICLAKIITSTPHIFIQATLASNIDIPPHFMPVPRPSPPVPQVIEIFRNIIPAKPEECPKA